MGKIFERIDDELREWIAKQSMFFVATAPREGGRINLSPKGYRDTFAILDDHTVAYLDVVGSGAETIAHIRENGRIVVMLCAFEGPPRILRLHGKGEVVQADDPKFDELLEQAAFERPEVKQSQRAIIVVHVERIADSCGYGVPLLAYEGERPHSDLSTAKRIRVEGPGAMRAYEAKHNRVSIDGLPALS